MFFKFSFFCYYIHFWRVSLTSILNHASFWCPFQAILPENTILSAVPLKLFLNSLLNRCGFWIYMFYCTRFIASTRRSKLSNLMTNFTVESWIMSCSLCGINQDLLHLFRLGYLFCSKNQRFVRFKIFRLLPSAPNPANIPIITV